MALKNFYGLTGQSNADLSSKLAAEYCLRRLPEVESGDEGWVTAQWNLGGQEISTWVDAAGNKGANWASSIAEFDSVIDACKAAGDEFSSFTIDWRQGERDTVQYAGDPTFGNYAVKLQNLIDCFVDYYEVKCGITPNITVAEITYDFTHPSYTTPTPYPANHQSTALGINDIIRSVVDQNDCVTFIDAADLALEDEVHLIDYDPTTSLGVGPQIDYAKRVLGNIKKLIQEPAQTQVSGDICEIARGETPEGDTVTLRMCADGTPVWVIVPEVSEYSGDSSLIQIAS